MTSPSHTAPPRDSGSAPFTPHVAPPPVVPAGGELKAGRPARGARDRALLVRLFVTVWLVYAAHFATNVVRETYLAVSLGERLSVRVDEFLGLHPDLFGIEGRGAYINNNPGASMLAAVPYAVARPVIGLVLAARPELAQPKPAATYADPRPNRTRFLNESRARGLDVKLALAAMAMHLGLMAPLGALVAVVLLSYLRARLGDPRTALALALLYAFGTPIFFRSAFLNQNAIVAHCALLAFLALTWPGRAAASRRRLLGAGALLGIAVLCDYSGAALALAFGLWVLGDGWRRAGIGEGLRAATTLTLGALPALALLLGYQWAAFGHPLWPAQHYMPPTELSVRGADGFAWPTAELLVGNLLDPRYGLFVFCPMLVAALAAPFLRRRAAGIQARELWLVFGACVALHLFSSANQYALLQWNTGVRYLVPAGSLLFVALVPVLLRLPPLWRLALVVPTVVVSWSVAMARESVPVSITRVFVRGFELPTLTVLHKTAGAYMPAAAEQVSPLPAFALLGVVLWLLWRGHVPPAARPATVEA